MEATLGLPEHGRQETTLRCGCRKTVIDHGFARYTEIDCSGECRTKKTERSMSKRLRFAVLDRDGFACQYCGRKAPDVELEIDHVKPVSLGGRTEIDNLKAACFDCNRGKHDSLIGGDA